MNPVATTCIAISLSIPNKLQANGINNNEPPATPEAPHAEIAAIKLSNNAVGKSTAIPKVLTAASVSTVIVIAAPPMLIVAPRGIETEYVSLCKLSFLHSSIFTGMFAADERVKKAVMPLSRRHWKINGYGFWRDMTNKIIGLITNATTAIEVNNTANK